VSDQDMPGPQDPRGGQDPAGVGSVGEEAAKLLGAVSDWARDQGTDVGQGLGGLASQAAASMQGINEHIATGSAECTYCPICRTVHTIRETSPEVRAHLATAASSFLQAAAALLATQVPKDDPRRGSSVERIDLDDDAGDDRNDGRAPGER
jgi:hypothetical protein